MNSESTDDSFVTVLAQQGGVTLVGKFGGRIFSFLFLIVVTHGVSPAIYGTFTLALAVVSVTQDLFNFNLYQSIDYFVPKALNEGDSALARGTVAFVSQVVLLGSTIGVVAVILIRGRIAAFFNTPSLAPYLAVIAVVILFQSLLNVQEKIFSSLKQMEYRVLISDIGFPLLKLVFVASLIYLGYDSLGLTIGYTLALALAVLAGTFFLLKRSDELNISLRSLYQETFSQKTQLFKYAFPLYLTGIMYAVSGQISYFVLGFYLGASEVGIYRVAYQLTTNLMLVNLAIAPIFKPMVSEIKERKTIDKKYRLAARWVVLFTVPMALVLVVAPDVYLRVLFSSDYIPAAAAVVPLSIGYLLNSLTGPESMLIEATGHTQLTLLNGIAKVGINTLLLVVFVPYFGILGAGMATGIAIAFIPLLGTAEMYYFESIHPFSTDTAKFLVSGAIAASAGLMLVRIISNDYLIAVLLPILVSLIYVATVRFAGGFSSDDERAAKIVDGFIGRRLFQRLI